ncbi:MAG: transposase, partial [Amphritea sp.]|nr:transposase [Amphritea sp.]
MTNKRRSYTPEYKLEAASLVLDQDYSVPEAARSLGLNENVLRRWVNQLRDERQGTTPAGKALTPEQQRIKELEAQVDRLQREKTILKKATVDSIGHCNSSTKILICMSTFDETSKANFYTGRERSDLQTLEARYRL